MNLAGADSMRRSGGSLRRALVGVLLVAPSAMTAFAAPSGGDASREGVAVDPRARSTCVRAAPGVSTGVVTLTLEGLAWDEWDRFCTTLATYLAPGAPPYDAGTVERAERLLAAPGYFRTVRCAIASSRTELECALTPAPIVRDVTVEGPLPFVLLRSELRRQVALHPGSLLPHPGPELQQEAQRLAAQLEAQGFFGSRVEIAQRVQDGEGEPNVAMRLEVRVRAGRTALLGRVNIEGPSVLDRADVEAAFRHNWLLWMFPRRFTPAQFSEDLETLTRQIRGRGYPDVLVLGKSALVRSGDAVDVELTIRPGLLLRVSFTGNRALDDAALRRLTTFEDDGSSDPVEIEKTRRRILSAYQGEGFYAAVVAARDTVTSTPAGQGASLVHEVTYAIDEGPRARITRVTFAGNRALTAEQIREAARIRTHASRFLSTGRWVDEIVDEDTRAIEAAYKGRGFAEVRVSAARAEIGAGDLEAIFTIDEGPRRMVSSLVIAGAPPGLSQAELRRPLKLVAGAPYVPSLLEDDRAALLMLLTARGYQRAVVTRTLQLPPGIEGGWVDIVYRIDPGPRTEFRGLLVRGNLRTSAGLIRSQLALSPGDPLDLGQVEAANRRLWELGTFAMVSLSPVGLTDRPIDAWLLAAVEERDLRRVEGVLTFRTDELFAVGLSARDENLLGRAIRADLEGQFSNASRVLGHPRIGLADRLELRLNAPDPFGLESRLEARGHFEFEDKTLYRLRALGIDLTATRQILSRSACASCPNVTFAPAYRLSSSELSVRDEALEGSKLPPSLRGARARLGQLLTVPNQTIARVAPRLNLERVDALGDPRQGYTLDLTLELAVPALSAGLGTTSAFWRCLGELGAYVPIAGGDPGAASSGARPALVVALGLRWGVVRPFDRNAEVPLTETLAYGGDFDVRGIEDRASTVAFLGATHLLTTSLELRWYFLNLPFGTLQLAPFSDSGFAAYRLRDLLRDPTVSLGTALRMATPVGPLSLAYAVPVVRPGAIVALDPGAMPRAGRVHLSFGYTF